MQIVLPAESHISISLKANSYCENHLQHTYQWSFSGRSQYEIVSGEKHNLTWRFGYLCQGALSCEHVDQGGLPNIGAPNNCKFWQFGLWALLQLDTALDVRGCLYSHLQRQPAI